MRMPLTILLVVPGLVLSAAAGAEEPFRPLPEPEAGGPSTPAPTAGSRFRRNRIGGSVGAAYVASTEHAISPNPTVLIGGRYTRLVRPSLGLSVMLRGTGFSGTDSQLFYSVDFGVTKYFGSEPAGITPYVGGGLGPTLTVKTARDEIGLGFNAFATAGLEYRWPRLVLFAEASVDALLDPANEAAHLPLSVVAGILAAW